MQVARDVARIMGIEGDLVGPGVFSGKYGNIDGNLGGKVAHDLSSP